MAYRENRTVTDRIIGVKFPQPKVSECRGVPRCCEPRKVFASSSSNEAWKNDKTSAWIKMGSGSDTAVFKLTKTDGTIITLTSANFPNQSFSKYATVNWQNILNSYGVGTYYLEIQYNISGVLGVVEWGVYELNEYSYTFVKDSIRLRAIFDHKQEIEGIDFTGAKVEDTIRINGMFGNRQPNTEIDNIIYENREMKSVIRENVQTYDLMTDPVLSDVTSILVDLYLLSEVQLYVTDYGAYSHEQLFEVPVIVQESPEVKYTDSLLASVTCKLGDKFKNKRTYYGG